MLVAELRILAFGNGTSQERPVELALEALAREGVRYEVGPLGTTIEAERLDDLLHAVKVCHEAAREAGGRVFTEFAIDDRLDKKETIGSLRDVDAPTSGEPRATTAAPGTVLGVSA